MLLIHSHMSTVLQSASLASSQRHSLPLHKAQNGPKLQGTLVKQARHAVSHSAWSAVERKSETQDSGGVANVLLASSPRFVAGITKL